MNALRQFLRANALPLSLLVMLWPLGMILERALNPYILQILIYIGINIILAVSLNLINGIAGMFSLGHAGFLAIGAYVSAACTMYAWPQAPAPVALPLALL